jgi:murein tripeptide amidase MpaA
MINGPSNYMLQYYDNSFVSNKRYLFISARVHPGEVPSSHVMNGLLKYLMSYQDVTADIARENFVWVLVPLINPDGVYRGHYRTDPWC